MSYTTELVIKIWNDKLGDRIEIGPDEDSLGLSEIKKYDSSGKCVATITSSIEEMILLSKAIKQLYGE